MEKTEPFYGNYPPNAIFRNQPSSTIFNVSFDTPDNPLYLILNDIDRNFMVAENIKVNRNYSDSVTIDPRSQEVISQKHIDVSLPCIIDPFPSNIESALTHVEHQSGVRIISSLQHNQECSENDREYWESLQNRLREESQTFLENFREHCLEQKENIYKSSQKLIKLYQIWYQQRKSFLQQRYSDGAYNTYMALLRVPISNTANQQGKMEICNTKILQCAGDTIELKQRPERDRSLLNLGFRNIDIFASIYIEDEMYKDRLLDEFQIEELIEKTFQENEDDEGAHFERPFPIVMPLNSILFLLTCDDYDDLPTEMIIQVKNSAMDSKYIVMDEPLPARDCGWHTNNHVMEQVVLTRLSTHNQRKESESITDTIMRNPTEYKLVDCDEYMSKCQQKQTKRCCFNQVLTKWCLKGIGRDEKWHSNEAEDHPIEIYTTMDISLSNTIQSSDPPVEEHGNRESLQSYAIKVEYNVEYGCEVMTRYELIREWLFLQLMKLPNHQRICYRFDVNSCDLFADEILTIERVQELLKSLYNIDMNILLYKLREFLKMLQNLPVDQYLLRYNQNYTDKIMICKRSDEITVNTFHLHKVLDTKPNNIRFLSQGNCLDIARDVCNRMHIDHQILPCCFKPSNLIDNSAKCSSYKAKLRSSQSNCKISPTAKQKKPPNTKKRIEKKLGTTTKIKKRTRKRKRKKCKK